MTAFVLDASVALRWFLEKAIPPYAAQIERFLLGGARALVPNLWHLEMANALIVAERRRLLLPIDLDRALQRIEQLLSHSIDTDGGVVSTREACAIARSWHLSAYDASYLYLARRKGLALATLDDELAKAARRSGIEIV